MTTAPQSAARPAQRARSRTPHAHAGIVCQAADDDQAHGQEPGQQGQGIDRITVLQPGRGNCAQGRQPEGDLPPIAEERSDHTAHRLGITLAAARAPATGRSDSQEHAHHQRPPLSRVGAVGYCSERSNKKEILHREGFILSRGARRHGSSPV